MGWDGKFSHSNVDTCNENWCPVLPFLKLYVFCVKVMTCLCHLFRRLVQIMRFSPAFRAKQDWEVGTCDQPGGILSKDAFNGLTSLHHVCQAPPGPQVAGMILYARELWDHDISSEFLVHSQAENKTLHFRLYAFYQPFLAVICQRDCMGRLALHYACVNGHDVLVEEMLLKVRSSIPGMVDYYDEFGWTPR